MIIRMIISGKQGACRGRRNAFAAFDVRRGGFDRLLHHDIADGLRDDLQDFENRTPLRDREASVRVKAREADFVRNHPENWQLDAPGIPELAAQAAS